ncbi:DUF6912 family protein [Embleya sp. NBC_00896]|uniref:DUF6912 family protein n=1 Tax=Embleya sp. NBC_00896 TaxID=2975961 RepID=UPI00386E5529|nr:hypothetical protein OG928_21365 [Embleya sp. NBC_00896]
MRVFIPTTPAGLSAVHAEGAIVSAPVRAYAVTDALRAWYETEDEEELEYGALTQAAEASLRLLAGEPGAVRRIVLAADVPDALVTARPQEGPATVVVDATVPRKRIAAVHMDTEEAEPAVAAALAGGLTDDLVEATEEHELLWFATQEIADLV